MMMADRMAWHVFARLLRMLVFGIVDVVDIKHFCRRSVFVRVRYHRHGNNAEKQPDQNQQ